jgi:Protein of unknown function (DUF1570)
LRFARKGISLFAVALASMSLVCFGPASLSAQQDVNVLVKGKTKETFGRTLALSGSQAILYRRDGRIVEFRKSDGYTFQSSNTVFEPYSGLKIQEHLQKLFGNRYEVSLTANYVVVHPRGKRDEWAEPFQSLYGRFTHYFAVRGFELHNPEFPLIVVVTETPEEFNRISQKDGLTNPESWAGYYSQVSNWIVTKGWVSPGEAESTLIHEALHQYAFNRGLHRRYAVTPKWGVEGLAAMFESPGVNDSRNHTADKDRIHGWYFKYMERLVDEPGEGKLLRELVASDEPFDRDPAEAYAWSWALVWYLTETRPAAFNEWLKLTSNRQQLVDYSTSQRLADFQRAFGIEFVMLERHLLRHIAEFK